MNVVYPINGYAPYGDGGQPQDQYPLQNTGYVAGGYPLQAAPGQVAYAPYTDGGQPASQYPPLNAGYPGGGYPPQAGPGQGASPYYAPPGGAYPPPSSNPYPAASLGQAYPMYNNMPPQGAYPAYPTGPPGSQPAMAAPYPAYGMQQPPTGYPDPNIPYGTPMKGQMYPTPGQPIVQYPMNIGSIPKPGSDLSNEYTMREWSVGLCGCTTHCIPNFFMPWCCPCVSLAQVYARVGLTAYRVALVRFFLLIVSGIVVRYIPVRGSPSKSTSTSTTISTTTNTLTGTAWYVFVVCQEIVVVISIAIARRRVRQRFKIPGNRCLDGIASFFCPCCTIAQMATHSRSYTPGSCDFMGPDVLPASL